jgi:uncharacterized protein YecE (DUF72 family)
MNDGADSRYQIRIGPAGWSYKDWEGVVYPPHGTRFDHLGYLASYFDTIEVNSSFYRTPPPTHAHSWVRRVAANEAFRFTVKLFRGFTHDAAADATEAAAFRAFLEPLADAGRLGAVLAQFPWSFRNSPEAKERLETIFRQFAPFPLVVEVRHGSFADASFQRFLTDANVGLANIDQPLFGDSMAPSESVTGEVAYARFHGRNYVKWFSHEETWERYDYLYSTAELEPWRDRIRSMARERDVYVIMNNHFRGQAVVNAIELGRGLGLEARVPEPLRSVYPQRLAAANFADDGS